MKKWILTGVAAGLALSVFGFFFIRGEEEEKIEINMMEAVELAGVEADKYYDDLHLAEVHSYDNDSNPCRTSGVDGKRQWWVVDFGNSKNNNVCVVICDGKVENVEAFDQSTTAGLLAEPENYISSEDAVNKAISCGLKAGDSVNDEDWTSGYNFRLFRGSLVEDPEKEYAIFEVVGVSEDGNYAHVEIDAKTGEILLKEEQYVDENNEYSWKTL